MNDQIPNRIITKTANTKDTLKLHEDRVSKVKKAVFDYLKNNQVEIISDEQVYHDGKNKPLIIFAENIKLILESTENKNFPKFTVDEYVSVLRMLNSEERNARDKLSTNSYSNSLTEDQILNLVPSNRLNFVKSREQAEEFLKHILFKVPESALQVKVIATRSYQVKDSTGQELTREKEIMLPGCKTLKEYEDTLRQFTVRSTDVSKQETYWDIFSRSKSIAHASMVYNPYKELYWCDEYKHYYVNSYTEPDWKKEPEYFYLMENHKKNPISIPLLSDLLRSFLQHLFPDKSTLREVLKWCAFSTTDKLQTYLTLIGPQGIGKNVLIDSFLGYYHGSDNLNKPENIETRFNEKNSKSTLLSFDEKVMVTLEQYNKMKSHVNSSLAFEDKYKSIYMSQNFANVVWSCNTQDTMSGMSRDDRRFKIVPITANKLIGAPIFNIDNKKIGIFTISAVNTLATSEDIKKEFVLLMLSIRDHVERNNETMDDINTVSENDARDAILSESRSLTFTGITDILKNVYNDYNEITGRFGKSPSTKEEKDALGTIYKDYIPLSELQIASDTFYTYRVPFGVIRKVIETLATKQNTISFRQFNRHLENMPLKYMRGYTRKGQQRDVEIKLDQEQHILFCETLMPVLSGIKFKKEKGAAHKVEEQKDENDPFDND